VNPDLVPAQAHARAACVKAASRPGRSQNKIRESLGIVQIGAAAGAEE